MPVTDREKRLREALEKAVMVLCETRGHSGRRPCQFCTDMHLYVLNEAIPETAVLADAGIELKPGIDPVIANHYHLVPKDMKCHKCGASEPWKHPSREEVSGVVDDPKTWEGIEKSWPTQPETAVLSEEQVPQEWHPPESLSKLADEWDKKEKYYQDLAGTQPANYAGGSFQGKAIGISICAAQLRTLLAAKPAQGSEPPPFPW